MNFDILPTFISPVTGRILCETDFVLVGSRKDVALPSPILIDMRLDMIRLRQNYNILTQASFVIGFPNPQLPQAQVLESLDDGIMFNTEGIVSTSETISIDNLPNLTKNYVWTGDTDNRPQEVQRLIIDNLPTFLNTDPTSLLGAYNLWTGSANPLKLGEPTTTLSIKRCNLPDLTVGTLWLGASVSALTDPLNFGSNRPTEITVLPLANMADLAFTRIWRGDVSGRPAESDDLTTLEAQVTNIEDVLIPGLEAEIAALEAEIVAIQAQLVVIGGEITILQVAVLALQAQVLAVIASVTAVNARIDALRLNTILADGDVSFYNFKLIDLADPVNPTDGVNLRTLTSAVGSITLEGFVEGGPPVAGVITTVRGPTCLLTNIPAGGDVSFDNYRITNLATLDASSWTDLEAKAQDGINFLFLWKLLGGGVR